MSGNKLIRGEIVTAFVTHVKDEKSFYFVTTEQFEREIEKIREIMKATTLKRIPVPEVNQKCIVQYEAIFVRAERIEAIDHEQESVPPIQIYLQDTGELLTLSSKEASSAEFYEIPKNIAAIPPLAQHGMWSGNDISEDTMEVSPGHSFLASTKYTMVTLEVRQTEPNTVVDIWPFDDNSHISDPADYDYDDDDERKQESAQTPTHSRDADGKQPSSLTEKELQVLFEEPLYTNSASIAVQGYETQDDKEICKFYDKTTGACFKGSRCKKVHLPPLQDGFETRDRKEIHYAHDAFELPAFFLCYDIKITHFYTLNRFVCVYANNDKARELESILNNEEEVRNYRKLSFVPSYHQLVILKDNDDRYLRSKVIEICDNSKECLLLLLDKGLFKNAPMAQLYEWRARSQHIEYLAVEMNIANVSPINDKISEAVDEIYRVQSKAGYLKARVVGYCTSIQCQLLDTEEIDIAEMLATRGLAVKNELEIVPLENIHCVPG